MYYIIICNLNKNYQINIIKRFNYQYNKININYDAFI